MTLKIYLAAPLFNDQERMFNEMLSRRLSPFCEVFLPQRDGALLVELIASGMSLEDSESFVFKKDCYAMRNADLLIAVLDGGYIDEGVAFEIGFTRALNIASVGLQTDLRRALPTGNNPMIQKGLERIFCSIEDLANWIIDISNAPHLANSA